MLTAKEIREVSFERVKFGGYRPENVNYFLDQVLASYEALQRENVELNKKLKVLAAKVEEYRSQEDNIGSVLVNAQKFSDSLYKEAKYKGELIIKDATIKAERLVQNAEREIAKEADKLKRMQKEVSDFRSRLLAIYKEHIELISVLPTYDEPEEEKIVHEQKAETESVKIVKKEEKPGDNVEKQEVKKPEVEKKGLSEKQEDPQEKVATGRALKLEKKPIEEKESDVKLSDLKIVKDSDRPLRFKEIKFGKDYDISEDDDY